MRALVMTLRLFTSHGSWVLGRQLSAMVCPLGPIVLLIQTVPPTSAIGG